LEKKMSKSRNRKLAAESLESRQLLHGGGLGMHGAATVDEQVEAVFERYDATEDGILNEADELSDRVTEWLAGADGDADGGVTVGELTVFYETERVSRLLGLSDSGGRCHRAGGDASERVEAAIEVIDDDGEGDLDQAEVSEELWEQIASADTDADASLNSDELVTLVETLDAERQAAFIADKVDSVFARYDADEDGSIVESEVSESRWARLSTADTDANEAVSQDELTTYVTEKLAARESTRGLLGGGHRGGGHHGHHGRGGRGR
jgi:Ca2+-binding EF-hand superfamily protein